jgi:hypothetical protein
MVTSSEPRSPIAEIVASMSALRRSGSIPTFGMLFPIFARRLFFIDGSINKKSTRPRPVPSDCRLPALHGLGKNVYI